MKIAPATLFLATVVAVDSEVLASNSVRGSVQNGPFAKEDLKDGVDVTTEESRTLGGEEYDTSYTEHCGCTFDFSKELSAAQMSIVSDLNPLVLIGDKEQLQTILHVLECCAKMGIELLRLFDCGCESIGENQFPSGADYDSAYKQCCCDADTLKDMIIAKMQEIANIPDCILALDGVAFGNQIEAIVCTSFPTILWIAKPHAEGGEDAVKSVLADAKDQLKRKTRESAQCAGVIITEIMYEPTEEQGDDDTGEWVEILNYSCESVDLDGWDIKDNFERDPLEPLDGLDNMVLGPGQYGLIIDGNGSSVLTNYDIAPGTRIFGTGDFKIGNQLANTGDNLTLFDANNVTVDVVVYDDTDGSGCGNEAAGQGWSLERVDPFGPGDCSNFRSQELKDNNFDKGGTPGSVNYLWNGTALPVPCVCEMGAEM